MVKKDVNIAMTLMEIMRMAALPPAKCSECGKKAELRPYGKNGAGICFECGMKDEKATAKRFKKYMKKD